MKYDALLLGSIGVLADTSDLQRRAFNAAFEAQGVDWHWDTDTYLELLKTPGGKNRIEAYAAQQGREVDVGAIYDAKVELFYIGLEKERVELRPGIADLIGEARTQGLKLGFVTGTDKRQVAGVLGALRDQVKPSLFDYIGNRTRVPRAKPATDIYNDALREIGVEADKALAIEDTPESAAAAIEAGIDTWAYPSVAEGRDFGDVIGTGTPDLELLRSDIAAQ